MGRERDGLEQSRLSRKGREEEGGLVQCTGRNRKRAGPNWDVVWVWKKDLSIFGIYNTQLFCMLKKKRNEFNSNGFTPKGFLVLHFKEILKDVNI